MVSVGEAVMQHYPCEVAVTLLTQIWSWVSEFTLDDCCSVILKSHNNNQGDPRGSQGQYLSVYCAVIPQRLRKLLSARLNSKLPFS
jgi:hypothetical protein